LTEGLNSGALSRSEIIKELQCLTDDDIVRLNKVARLYAAKTAFDHEDLYQEALCRLIEGRRTWPRGALAVWIIRGILRSVAYEWRRIDLPESGHLSQSPPIQEWAVFLNEVIESFASDPIALTVLHGMLEGARGHELQEFAGIEASGPEYESVRKRIRRRLEKLSATPLDTRKRRTP
jgi:DNA-directed RNA polymerase specialized sigma24 family protein